jgi:hypothetical protein
MALSWGLSVEMLATGNMYACMCLSHHEGCILLSRGLKLCQRGSWFLLRIFIPAFCMYEHRKFLYAQYLTFSCRVFFLRGLIHFY